MAWSSGAIPNTDSTAQPQLGMSVTLGHDSRSGMTEQYLNNGLSGQIPPDQYSAAAPGHPHHPESGVSFPGPTYGVFKAEATAFQSHGPHLVPPPSASSQPGQISWQYSPMSTALNDPSPSSQHPSVSPFTQTMSPAPVSDSAYWSMPESNQGIGSTSVNRERTSQDSSTHPGEENATPPTTPSDVDRRDVVSGHHLNHYRHLRADRGDRSRQDAHSKVEKRYRTNINNKIEQLRGLLPSNPALENQYGDPVDSFPASRRRKCGTELSKRDVLSATILRLEQLELEKRDLAVENQELKEKLALYSSRDRKR